MLEYTWQIFFDLSRAFDCINIKFIESKLYNLGFKISYKNIVVKMFMWHLATIFERTLKCLITNLYIIIHCSRYLSMVDTTYSTSMNFKLTPLSVTLVLRAKLEMAKLRPTWSNQYIFTVMSVKIFSFRNFKGAAGSLYVYV